MENLFSTATGSQRVVFGEDDKERLYLEKKYACLMRADLSLGRLVSYIGNKNVPLLRLYRYKEAFAFEFVKRFLKSFNLTKNDYVFDPFAGMGTTGFAAMLQGIPSIGIDKLPIAVFVAETIPLFFQIKAESLRETFDKLRKVAQSIKPARVALDVPIMRVAFDEKTLLKLRRWKAAIDTLPEPLRQIFLLLFFSILESCSYASKDGQFLRLKKAKTPADPETELRGKVSQAIQDIEVMKLLTRVNTIDPSVVPRFYLGDARDLSNIPFERKPTALITSPPYPNRYDYSRTYSLELCFHFAKNFEELKTIRFNLLRSHIESKVAEEEQAPHPAVAEVVNILKQRKLNNPRVPYMLTAYFVDMNKVIKEWSRVLAPGAKVAMVVDNVRFDGEILPTDLILSDMAEEAGFTVKEVIIARYKGNSSQQMKKYGKVPVRESVVLWQLEA